MATRGIGYFDSKGLFYKTAEEATISDIAAFLGRAGDSDGVAYGIAKTILARRGDIETIFAAHDQLVLELV